MLKDRKFAFSYIKCKFYIFFGIFVLREFFHIGVPFWVNVSSRSNFLPKLPKFCHFVICGQTWLTGIKMARHRDVEHRCIVFYRLVLYVEYHKTTKNDVRQTFLGDIESSKYLGIFPKFVFLVYIIDQKYKFRKNSQIFAGPV